MKITKHDFFYNCKECLNPQRLSLDKSKLEDMGKEYLRLLRVHMFDKEQMDDEHLPDEPPTKRDMEFMNQAFEVAIEIFKQQNPYLQDTEDIDVPDNLDQVSCPQKASTSKCQEEEQKK